MLDAMDLSDCFLWNINYISYYFTCNPETNHFHGLALGFQFVIPVSEMKISEKILC